MNISGVYKITSEVNKKRCYIGSAVNISARWSDHLGRLRKNKHPNLKLQRHFNKYGENELVFSILLICDKPSLIVNEQFFIDFYHPYFNICKIAGSCFGIKRSVETCKKISEKAMGHKRNLGKRLSKERVDYLHLCLKNRIISPLEHKHRSDSHKGKSLHSIEHRVNIGKRMKGNQYRLGSKDTVITKMKKSESAKKAWKIRHLNKIA